MEEKGRYFIIRNQMNQKVLLAFSGGLDTTYCTIFLQNQGYEVHTVTVNTGGFTVAELEELSDRAGHLGSKSHLNIDVTEEKGRYFIIRNQMNQK
ncbi:MAG: argininosuccinate synthase domain-containing protein, partial [Bacteroidota bacterium]